MKHKPQGDGGPNEEIAVENSECKEVALMQGTPLGYGCFAHTSNYSRRNHFWIQVAVSLLKPPHGVLGSETAAA
jgi:hypothetical protein